MRLEVRLEVRLEGDGTGLEVRLRGSSMWVVFVRLSV